MAGLRFRRFATAGLLLGVTALTAVAQTTSGGFPTINVVDPLDPVDPGDPNDPGTGIGTGDRSAGAAGSAGGLQRVGGAYQTGGIQLTVRTGLRFEIEDNPGLNSNGGDTETELSVPLSFGLLSETETDRIAFDVGGELLARGGGDGASGFEAPFARFSYDRSSAASRLALRASLREVDLDRDAFAIVDGIVTTVDGDATQRSSAVEARYDWGDDRRVGYGVFVRRSNVSFDGGTATDLTGEVLEDSRRTTLGASARLDLTEAAILSLGLTWSDFRFTDGPADEQTTVAFDAGLTLARPLGEWTVGVGVTDTETGERLSASVGRVLELPRGRVEGSAGVTRDTDGDLVVTVDLEGVRQMTPNGVLNYGLSRDVTSGDEDDDERIVTSVSLGYAQDLTPVSRVQFDLGYVRSEETATDQTGDFTTLGARYVRELSPDWNMSLGYTHRRRDEDGSGSADSNQIFLQLDRVFVTRF